ncbi:MAG TPA: 5'-3' exonuclease H3TH domain-containing protein [Polyangiaceae bacterium]|jgi:5'-3' exonuclease
MRLHVVDGTYELFRAHFSKRPDHLDPQGRDRKATVGVAASMLSLLRDPAERATHLAIAFDRPIRSFRNDLFAGYKTDEGMAPELLDQFGPVEDAMRAIGVVVWSMDAWEADDALATAAARYGSEVEQVRIMTPDKDLGQCLRGERVVQVDRMRNRIIDEGALLATVGIAPTSVPDFLALVGDTADGIPGLPGFGKKTAATLLHAYGHLEKIPERASDWGPKVRGADVLAATLLEHREEALLYRHLATLVETVPLRESLDDLRWRGVAADSFEAWCKETGAPDGVRELAARTMPLGEGS